MDLQQAMTILGIDQTADLEQVKRVYITLINNAKSKTVGKNHNRRKQYEQQITEITTAFEIVKKHLENSSQPLPTAAQNVITYDKNVIAMAFVLIVLVFSVLVPMLIGNSIRKRIYDQSDVRVISVPWCDVYIDGEYAGKSGRPQPFKISTGKHRFVFKRGPEALVKKIKTKKDVEMVIFVNIKRKRIDVREQ